MYFLNDHLKCFENCSSQFLDPQNIYLDLRKVKIGWETRLLDPKINTILFTSEGTQSYGCDVSLPIDLGSFSSGGGRIGII